MTLIEAAVRDTARRVKASKVVMALIMLIVVVPAVVHSFWATVALAGLLVVAVIQELQIAQARLGGSLKADVLSCVLLTQMMCGIGCLIWIRSLPDGIAILVVVAVCVFVNDAMAQVTGKSFQKFGLATRQLVPRISPNKTWEGFVGGLVGGWLAGWLTVQIMLAMSTGLPVQIYLIVIVCPPLAVAGDLIESWTKRSLGDLKDFGNLLGKHGGVMDRIDAITLALIGTALILQWGIGM